MLLARAPIRIGRPSMTKSLTGSLLSLRQAADYLLSFVADIAPAAAGEAGGGDHEAA